MPNNDVHGAPGTIRTSDPQIRSLVLYPAELRARFSQAFRDQGLLCRVQSEYIFCRSRKRAIASGSDPAWQASSRPCATPRVFGCRSRLRKFLIGNAAKFHPISADFPNPRPLQEHPFGEELLLTLFAGWRSQLWETPEEPATRVA
jgi:hypothetical protein